LQRSETNADLAAWPGLTRKTRGCYEMKLVCLYLGSAEKQVVLLNRVWPLSEEAIAKRVAAACWAARRALLAARPGAGEAEQRAAVEDALLEASAPGALDAWRLLQRAEGGEAPADSAAELSAPQLDAACTLLAAGRNYWRGLPTFVQQGKLVLSKIALQKLAKQLRRKERPRRG